MKIPIITAVMTGSEQTVKGTGIAAATSGAASIATADWAMQVFGVPATVIFACFCGAAVALRFLPKMNRAGMFLALGTGTIAGAYLTPFVSGWLDTKHIGAIGFGIGLCSHAGLTILFNNAEKWLNRKFGAE